MFETLSGCDSISLKFNATVTTYWKHLLSSFFNFIVVFVFFIKSGESRYEQQHPKWVMGALRKQNLWFIGKKKLEMDIENVVIERAYRTGKKKQE